MNRSDFVFERGHRAPEPELKPSYLVDAMRKSLRRGQARRPRHGHEYRRGRCVCGVPTANHFNRLNELVGCAEAAKERG